MGENQDLPLAAFSSILGAAIRSRRTAMGFSTSELARRSNGQITRSAIALIEDGRVDARMVCSITQTWTF
jgi:predicted transcriptional regulator